MSALVGRAEQGHVLRAGTYVLTITASNVDGSSKPVALKLWIISHSAKARR